MTARAAYREWVRPLLTAMDDDFGILFMAHKSA